MMGSYDRAPGLWGLAFVVAGCGEPAIDLAVVRLNDDGQELLVVREDGSVSRVPAPNAGQAVPTAAPASPIWTGDGGALAFRQSVYFTVDGRRVRSLLESPLPCYGCYNLTARSLAASWLVVSAAGWDPVGGKPNYNQAWILVDPDVPAQAESIIKGCADADARGRVLAWVRGEGSPDIVLLDGEDRTTIFGGDEVVPCPRLAPVGDFVLFSPVAAKTEVWRRDLVGGEDLLLADFDADVRVTVASDGTVAAGRNQSDLSILMTDTGESLGEWRVGEFRHWTARGHEILTTRPCADGVELVLIDPVADSAQTLFACDEIEPWGLSGDGTAVLLRRSCGPEQGHDIILVPLNPGKPPRTLQACEPGVWTSVEDASGDRTAIQHDDDILVVSGTGAILQRIPDGRSPALRPSSRSYVLRTRPGDTRL